MRGREGRKRDERRDERMVEKSSRLHAVPLKLTIIEVEFLIAPTALL
jgi:hypothetical protein